MQRFLNKETVKYINGEVKVAGWVNKIRSHGKIIFCDLRDITGILQLVFTQKNKELYKTAQKLRPEWVIEVSGKINKRPKKMENPDLETGKVELEVKEIEVFSETETPPIPINGDGYKIAEEKRLKYRYLDLRRKRMRKNLKKRQETIQFMREFLQKKGFLEIETPILTKSTPEGARDFLVPSRLYPGKFYALPQSPQQYKQLLQVAGIEKYFQIARCFRDEDPRADRQPEFTQLDFEMSFVNQDDILNLTEELYIGLIEKVFPKKKIAKTPFPRLKYKDVMKKYKTDRPDLRENKKNKDILAFCFVTNFPMFEWKESDKKWGAMHHPFTRPQTENVEKIKKKPENVLAFQYDLVLNGEEIGGGSLRSYKPDILEAVFEVLGHTKEDIQKKFGHLFEAFKYGVPPHGGIAPGIDRFLAIALGEPNIREVIAFPKTGDNRGLMMKVPAKVTKEQLKELGLEIKKKKKT